MFSQRIEQKKKRDNIDEKIVRTVSKNNCFLRKLETYLQKKNVPV